MIPHEHSRPSLITPHKPRCSQVLGKHAIVCAEWTIRTNTFNGHMGGPGWRQWFQYQHPTKKPRKLTELTYQSLRTFLTEFRQYHLESKGQATLHGHISDKIVTVIDTILGTNRKYAYLLGHGHNVCVPDLTEEERRDYPWLHTSTKSEWTALVETLKVLRPEGGGKKRNLSRKWMASQKKPPRDTPDPCERCGAANKHARQGKGALSKAECSLRDHSDGDKDDVPFSKSQAAKQCGGTKYPVCGQMERQCQGER
jgi:hypothetical protein